MDRLEVFTVGFICGFVVGVMTAAAVYLWRLA